MVAVIGGEGRKKGSNRVVVMVVVEKIEVRVLENGGENDLDDVQNNY